MEHIANFERLSFSEGQLKELKIKQKTWKSRLQFTSCCLAVTVGVGNIWRFPFVVLNNGGVTFLICYFIVTLLVGIPLYYLEMVLGQFTSMRNLQVFKALAPGFAGIGWSQIMAALSISTYYGGLLTYMFHYFGQSFSTVMPWTICKDGWHNCITSANISTKSYSNYQTSQELYFNKEVLQLRSIHHDIGVPSGRLLICSFFVWVINFVILSRGIEWFGNISYFLAYFPYFTFCILMGRITRLSGASQGIKLIFKSNWSLLFEAKTWFEATAQCLLSLGQGIGTITTLASYNKFHCHTKVIASFVVIADMVTSFLFAFTTFSVLGNLSNQMNVTIDEIPNKGPELVFVSYAYTLSTVQAPKTYTAVFYFTLFVISMGSLQGVQLVLVENLRYFFPSLQYWAVVLIVTVSCFAISIMYLTRGGLYLIQLVSTYADSVVVILLVTVILMAVIYVYGLQNICWDVEYMTQKKLDIYWRISWAVIDAILITSTTIYIFLTAGSFAKNQRIYPKYYQTLGWILVLVIILPIPIQMVLRLLPNLKYGFVQGVRKTFSKHKWRPADNEHYEEWKLLKSAAKIKVYESGDSGPTKLFKSIFRMYN